MTGLLPNGKQTFFDANGNPLAMGTVAHYVPGTTTPKDTYADQANTVLNTNPVRLDASGRAVIWGAGLYRQVVKDSAGNLIWDQITYASGTAIVQLEHTVSGNPLGSGVSGDLYIDFDCEITKVIVLCRESGSIIFDIWVAPFVEGSAPTVADTIVASSPPTVSSALNSVDEALTGWSKTLNAGDHIRFYVQSATTTERATIILVCDATAAE